MLMLSGGVVPANMLRMIIIYWVVIHPTSRALQRGHLAQPLSSGTMTTVYGIFIGALNGWDGFQFTMAGSLETRGTDV